MIACSSDCTSVVALMDFGSLVVVVAFDAVAGSDSCDSSGLVHSWVDSAVLPGLLLDLPVLLDELSPLATFAS